ncbi:hypothetical protein JQC92_10535 [Shewanella sp. 202IG2-18]|uniref:hypothetical protein n=1 Tax=Parashewanella hymeniacidonis TaxID=2807618 RepID=UPI001960FEB2|nr:hypothetical protein [Parashewanella hymeniacidonis]MBM7072464.1 hypothetical protein [Parashewanella hymeniacidonis]
MQLALRGLLSFKYHGYIEWSVTQLSQNGHLLDNQAEQLRTVALHKFHEVKKMKSKPHDDTSTSKACQKVEEDYKFKLQPLTSSHENESLYEVTFTSDKNSAYGDKWVHLGQVILVDTPTSQD